VLLAAAVAGFAGTATAAGELSVSAFVCPEGTDPALDDATLTSTCATAAPDTTFALTANERTRGRVAAASKPASWPAVTGAFTLSIQTPTGEPAIVLCDQDGATTRFEAVAGAIEGNLADGATLACRWYRNLIPASAVPTPTVSPTVEQTNGSQADFAGRVDIGGRSLFLSCTGAGSPTVLLEAGGPGGFSDRWSAIVPQIAQTTRVCSYDRAGVGQSDPAPAGVRSLQNSVDDLKALLTAVPIGCPCVMVGESWGGSLIRIYADQHPEDVAGLVFVDALPVGFIERFLDLVPSDASGFSSLMGVDSVERMDQLASLRLADTAAVPAGIPMVVITHGLYLGLPLNFPVDDLELTWRTAQHDDARAHHARFVIAKTSGNSIITVQPELIVSETAIVLGAVRDPASVQTSIVVERLDPLGRLAPGPCYQIWTDKGGGAQGEFRGGACDADVDQIDDGIVYLGPLPPGDYVVQEATSPPGATAEPDRAVAVTGLETLVTVQPPSPATPAAGTPPAGTPPVGTPTS
jgi:pimeloyl-ACP methyl ester carboxylesterase